ncbi:MAG: hypothetical protein FWG89_02535 [Treponema sp.]|nr:hypothetical protein [Treponema sp.]
MIKRIMTLLRCVVSVYLFLLLPGCPNGNGSIPGNSLAGKLLILQAYGTGNEIQNGVSHSFVELYNNTNNEIDLAGINLWYAAGTRPANIGDPIATQDGPWESIPLTGKIPAKGSYLILGGRPTDNPSNNTTRLILENNSGDRNIAGFHLSNRSFKIALIRNTTQLNNSIQNPYNTGNGTPVTGLIDLVGALNDPDHARPDQILGYKTAPARNSGSVAVRRGSLTDTGNNSVDFIAARYGSGAGMLTNEEVAVRGPRNTTETAGGWNPFAEPNPVVGTEALMILQANTYGNINNNFPAGFPASLVELYNNTNTAINFNTVDYYLHIANGTDWNPAIKLTGSVPALSSFLIVSTSDINSFEHRANLPTPDMSLAFAIPNGDFAIAIVRNQATLTGNPFGNTALAADYVDMLGVGNSFFEGAAFTNQSRPRVPRRNSLADTNNNATDFADVDYRSGGPHSHLTNELFKVWPRNSGMGTWDPMTGLPQVNPVIP